jgi:GNS1/SUR4 family
MAAYIAEISSITNVFMYTFYFVASFPKPIILKITNKLKPLLSLLQFAQLIIIIAHCIIAIMPSCNSGYFFHLQLVHFLASGFLFGKFFITSVHMKDVKAEKMLKKLGNSWEEC